MKNYILEEDCSTRRQRQVVFFIYVTTKYDICICFSWETKTNHYIYLIFHHIYAFSRHIVGCLSFICQEKYCISELLEGCIYLILKTMNVV